MDLRIAKHKFPVQNRQVLRVDGEKLLMKKRNRQASDEACRFLVEARGIEPLSENQSLRFSTSVFGYLRSHHTPITDDLRNQVSFLCVIASKAKGQFTFIAA